MQLISVFFSWFFFLPTSDMFFPFELEFFSFKGCWKHVLGKLSVVLKVFVLGKFLFAFFFLYFKSYLLLYWMVLFVTSLIFWVILSVEFSLQVTKVLVGFTVVLISVIWFIINFFAWFFSSETLCFFCEKANVESIFICRCLCC